MSNILIVDDEPLYRESIKKIIDWKSLMLSVPDEAINGFDALEKIKKEKYELIITDIRMPQMDGLSLIREASIISPESCFVVLSAYDDFALVKDAFKIGVIDYILKHQISQDEILRVIENFRHKEIDKKFNERSYIRSTIMNIKNGIIPEKDAADMLSLPSFAEGGRIYPSKSQIHLINSMENNTHQESQVLLDIEKDLNVQFNNLYIESSSRLSFYFLSDKVLSWGDLDAYWRTVHDFYNKKLINSGYTMSMGFSLNSNSFKNLKIAMAEAEACLQWYINRGKGVLLSPQKIRIEDKHPNLFPSTEKLSNDMINLSNDMASDAVLTMCIKKNNYRNTDPELIVSYYRRVNAHIVSALEALKLLENEEVRNFMSFFNKRSGWDIDDYNSNLKMIVDLFKNIKSISNKQIADVVQYMRNNYKKELTLSAIAEDFNLNASYLSRLFAKEMNVGFSKYLGKIRIKEAEKLLDSGKVNVSEAGTIVGISQPETFCRTFKRINGISPQKYLYSNSKKLTD